MEEEDRERLIFMGQGEMGEMGEQNINIVSYLPTLPTLPTLYHPKTWEAAAIPAPELAP